MQTKSVKATLYRWAGSWGPFKVSIPCGECILTRDILSDAFENELADIPVELETKDWLSHWWEPLRYKGWHAPILIVEGQLVSQGEALNRGLLVQAIIKAWGQRDNLQGNIVFGKSTCPASAKAKDMLDDKGIEYQYFDVVKDSKALYRMISEVKTIVGEKAPVTVPQIWLDSTYVGGADQLQTWLDHRKSPNTS